MEPQLVDYEIAIDALLLLESSIELFDAALIKPSYHRYIGAIRAGLEARAHEASCEPSKVSNVRTDTAAQNRARIRWLHALEAPRPQVPSFFKPPHSM